MTCVGHIVHLWPKFAPERSEGANDDKGTNKLYARQKSCHYRYYEYTMLFHKERLFNMKPC